MKYVKVRGLEKDVAQLFLGTSWFTPATEETAFDILDKYFAKGGNAIDTGRFYSGGVTEGVLRRWIESRNMMSKRESFVIVNKACHHYVDENNVHHPEISRVKPEYITEDLEYSLEDMKQPYFDIYLLHRDNEKEPVEGLMDRLEKHRREGKIKTYGVSNWSVARIAAAQEYAKKMGYQGISVNSPSYSLATVTTARWVGCVYADDAYVAWHKDRGISLLAWAPSASGYFAGRFGPDSPEDLRHTYCTPVNEEKLERCRVLAKKHGCEPSNIALAYIFNQPVTVMASIGPHREKTLDESIAALDIPLTPEEVEWLSLRKDSL